MFKKSFSIITVIVSVAILYSCGSSNPFIDEAKSSLKSNNPTAALNAAEKSIQNRPGDPLGYYYKGVALGDIAGGKEVDERTEDYKTMVKLFDTAQLIADTSKADKPDDISRIANIKINLWEKEYNQGVEFATSDSLMQVTENPFKVATSHLKNATTIMPDSASSWSALAQIAYLDNNFDLAIKAKEKALDFTPNPSAEDYSVLVAYYASNDNMEGALSILEEAVEAYPNNLELTSSLADAYQQTGQTQKAIETVEALTEKQPDNPQFHLVLGTQIYRTALKLDEEISANYDKIYELQQQIKGASGNQKSEIQNQIDQLQSKNSNLQKEYNSLSERAENELKTVIEYRPDDADAYNTLAIIYQNKAAALFDKRNRTNDIKKANEIDVQGKNELTKAMNFYEKAAEIDPDNKKYWESLFSVYTTLGMDEKADEAMKKAGIEQ